MHPTDSLLNDYADDELTEGERVSVDDHLRGCERCRAVVGDLREMRRATNSLRLLEPPAGVWRRIESSIVGRQSAVVGRESAVVGGHFDSAAAAAGQQAAVLAGSRRAASGGRLLILGLAAAAALVVATFVGFRALDRGGAGSVAFEEPPSAQAIEAELLQAQEHYQKAIRGLELVANADTGALDPRTAATLRQSLAVVDVAIEESRAALRTQPDSEPAQASLLDSFKAKVALLQDTIALINETRQETGDRTIVSGSKRGI